MGEEPMSLSSVSLREKKALVSAVSQAVEAILAQFSSSRTVVQKALSGDSAVNPSLGRLVLQCLCPALHRLLTDGLKPHQSDLIAGRRPNSAWGLVQASTRPGLKTQALYNLQNRVGELPQLRQSKHKFNAFIFGLLNAKLLDFWLSHLQTCIDVLDTFYYPSSFMLLSLTACQHVYQELLLVLQPLSLLTFNLDLLFQHHHLETHSPQIPSPPSCGAGVQQPARKLHSKPSESRYFESLSGVDFGNPDKQDGLNSGKSSSGVSEDWCTETSPQLMWVQEKRIADLPPPNMEEDSLAQQAGQVIQQGWGAMMRWGGRLSQNLTELSLSAARKEDMKTDLSELPDQAVSDFAPLNSSAQVPWGLGRLFGASRCHSAPSRRPSQWLAPGVTALTRIMSSSSTPAPRNKDSVPLENVKPVTDSKINNVVMDTTRPLRSVRMLCDHKGSGSELSFSKGEELVVLGGIDQDWIRCRQGDKEGLVQIGYTSIIM
ncbi:AP-4 complex accessory subunit RUSC1 isoform 3-T4 [Synchiropus picturatus]